MSPARITAGHIARHTPPGAGAQGRDAAIVDVAQDLLLRHLHQHGALGRLAFKGGTALRKLYAGTDGRFSLDLDFAVAKITDDPDDVLTELIAEVDGLAISPFRYHCVERRGKWAIIYEHTLGGPAVTLQSKLDLAPPPWLPPVQRGWQPLPIHSQYGDPPLPEIWAVQLAENLAEKISRLNRDTPARDLYDLRWAATNSSAAGPLDEALIRRLAVLKIWVDANGLHGGGHHWPPGHEGPPFDPSRWLRDRSTREFDTEDMGALSPSAPTAADLSATLRSRYRFLADIDPDEQVLARVDERDRPLALNLLARLPGGRLSGIGLY